MSIALVAVLTAASLTSLYRWTWVSQKEHYLAPSVLLFVKRWAKASAWDAVTAFTAVGAAAAVLALTAVSSVETRILAIGAAVASASFPVSMPPRPVRLRFTRRALTQAATAAILVAGAALSAVYAAQDISVGIVAVLVVPAVVDLAAWMLRPLERRLARRHVDDAATKLRKIGPRVVAITGSWGKTSTKNHVAELVSGTYRTVASPASWNNMAGLARTVNEFLVPGTEVLVAEMGTYGIGEIRAMCGWVRPEIAVICEIGPMHLERMGSIDNVLKAKAEIAETADHVVLWIDNPYLENLSRQLGQGRKVWRVGSAGSQALDVRVQDDGVGSEIFSGETRIGSLPLDTGLKKGNIACAVAVALALGVPAAEIALRLAHLTPPPHRAVAAQDPRGVWIIDDTYNANPAGAAASVASLMQITAAGRRVVVTPGMVELGALQADANQEFARTVKDAGAELVIVGRTNRRSLLRGYGPEAVTVRSRDSARRWLAATAQAGDAVLWENDLPSHYP